MDRNIEQKSVEDFIKEYEDRWNYMTPEEQEAQRAANLAEQEEWERKNAGKSIEQIMGEGLAESMGMPDWKYGDLPKLTKEYFDKFVEIVGEDNIRWLTYVKYPANFRKWNNPEDLYRGQYLLSPAGQVRAKAYASKS